MKRLVKAAALTLTLAMTAVSAGCGSNDEENTLTVAYAPNESTEQSVDARNGLAEDLKAELGMEVEEIQATDYNAIIEALRTGKADLAYMGPFAIALGNERAGVEPIAMKADFGDKSQAIYHSLLVTNSANEDINSITDIKGRTIAFVDPDSTSGNLIPTAEIINVFPDENLTSEMLHTNGEFFEAASYSGKHQAGLQAVAMGDVDIAPISDQILASEIENGNVNEEDIKIIHTSGDIPAEGMVVRGDLDPELKQQLQDFLINYDNEEYFDKVIKNPDARFVESDLSDYQAIIELNDLLNSEE